MVELLKQGQYAMLPVEQQIAVIYAGTSGVLDQIPLTEIARYERELFAFLAARHPQLLTDLRERGALRGKAFDEVWGKLESELKAALTEFGKEFVARPPAGGVVAPSTSTASAAA